MPVEPAVLVKDDQDHLIHPLHHPSDHLEPMVYVQGRGATITDIQGREYIDGLAGLWNVNVGHGREELAQAAFDQIKQLAYFSAYTGSTNIPAVQLASKLISLAYPNMQAVFFTSGGAESNESAFKTARFYWKTQGKPDKVKVIARTLAYHGVTLQAMSATGMSPYWKMFEPRVPNFLHVPTCYPYRQEGAKPGETAGQTAARLLEEAILREGPDTVAAFIAEPIHGGGGVLYPTDDYFPLVRQVCDRHKVLFIADEVITGFCRTGKWFALEHWNVLPDIMSFAKGVSSGYLPLGGIMVSKAIKQAMDEVKPEDRWMHAYTYSGHPDVLRGRAQEHRDHGARAALGARRRHGQAAARQLARRLRRPQARGRYPKRQGLLAAIELVEDKATKASFAADKKVGPRVLQEMAKRGVMTRARLEHIFFSPPLVISEAEVDRLVSVTRDALKAVTGV